MMSYLSENEAKNLQTGDVHLAQIATQTLEWNISRTVWCIEVSNDSLFCIDKNLNCNLSIFPISFM